MKYFSFYLKNILEFVTKITTLFTLPTYKNEVFHPIISDLSLRHLLLLHLYLPNPILMPGTKQVGIHTGNNFQLAGGSATSHNRMNPWWESKPSTAPKMDALTIKPARKTVYIFCNHTAKLKAFQNLSLKCTSNKNSCLVTSVFNMLLDYQFISNLISCFSIGIN